MRPDAMHAEKKRKKESSPLGPSAETLKPPRRSSAANPGPRTPELTESQVQDVIAKCLPFILTLVPKALKAFDQALSSDNPRLQMAAAAKLFEGIGLLGRRGEDSLRQTAEALEQREQEKSLMVAGIFWKTMTDKAEIYKWPVPPTIAWLAPKIRALQQEIIDKRNAGTLDNRDPAESEFPPLRSHSGRDPSKAGVRG